AVNFSTADVTNPAEQTIAGSISTPTGYDVNRNVEYGVSMGRFKRQIVEVTASSNFTFNAPSGTELSFYVAAFARQTSTTDDRQTAFIRDNLAPGRTGVALTLEAAPQLALLVLEATGVDLSTPFSWSPGGGAGVNVFIAEPDVSTAPTYAVILS